MTKSDESSITKIDAALANWRQGDCVLGEHWFVYRNDEGLQEDAVRGFVVLTQTCDIIRAPESRGFIEVAPLVEVEPHLLDQIRKMRRPQYAYVPGVADKQLVADLDRVMAFSKAGASTWCRTAGCITDLQARAFAQALTRKISRFAFPDDFQDFVGKIRARMQKKHGVQSLEGRALHELSEIRVRAESWNAQNVSLFFWFICGNNISPELQENREELTDAWLKLLPAKGRFTSIDGRIVTYEDITAADYLESDGLDFGYMSDPDSSE